RILRFLPIPAGFEQAAEENVGAEIARVALNRLLIVRDRLVGRTLISFGAGEEQVCRRVVRIDVDGFLECGLGGGAIGVLRLGLAEEEVHVATGWDFRNLILDSAKSLLRLFALKIDVDETREGID